MPSWWITKDLTRTVLFMTLCSGVLSMLLSFIYVVQCSRSLLKLLHSGELQQNSATSGSLFQTFAVWRAKLKRAKRICWRQIQPLATRISVRAHSGAIVQQRAGNIHSHVVGASSNVRPKVRAKGHKNQMNNAKQSSFVHQHPAIHMTVARHFL